MFGIYTRIRRYSKNFGDLCQTAFYKHKREGKTFIFNRRKYNYFIHPYNYTWRNERIIEIPIIRKLFEENSGLDILEIGNVMSHYINTYHDCLDKYEKSEGVINRDVVNYKSKKKYDLIISVSTLEHIGWDEPVRDLIKILKSVTNLKKMLKPQGQIFFTHPLGYNFYMDEYIRNGQLKLDKIYLMQRISRDNRWKQFSWRKQLIRYHYPFDHANGVLIGVIKK